MKKNTSKDTNLSKAKKAKEKKALFGPDINLNDFSDTAPKHDYLSDASKLSKEEQKSLISVGVDVNKKDRSGTFIHKDNSVVHCNVSQEGVEVLSVNDALKKYEWLSDFYGKAVDPGTDKYTAHTELKPVNGYFIRSKKGIKSKFPVQTCLYIGEENFAQNVHNIIIAEENSELNIITGCTTAPHLNSGMHIGVSEFYVKSNAKVTFTMIHNWNENLIVRPRSGVIVEENGKFISNYVCMKKAKSLQMYPTVNLNGKNSVTQMNSILVAPMDSELDIGAKVVLNEKGARAEIISRAITTGGKIMARGHLIGNAPGIKAHLECRGLILSDRGVVHAIPELEGHAKDVDMSHEAAVGKIAQDEIEYLMARGLTEDEATSTIVRGFLNVDIEGLPRQLKDEIDKLINSSDAGGM